jgi:hypothetical protein
MNLFVSRRAVSRALVALACSGAGPLAQSVTPELTEGTTFELGGTTVLVHEVKALPYVESEYTRRFRFDSADNPKLRVLRQRYQLEAVVAPGRDEFDRQVLFRGCLSSIFGW